MMHLQLVHKNKETTACATTTIRILSLIIYVYAFVYAACTTSTYMYGNYGMYICIQCLLIFTTSTYMNDSHGMCIGFDDYTFLPLIYSQVNYAFAYKGYMYVSTTSTCLKVNHSMYL